MVVELFEVAVDGCSSFLLLVTTRTRSCAILSLLSKFVVESLGCNILTTVMTHIAL